MHFRDLNEAQILALAITAEEEDARIYRDFAESLHADFPATAELFTRMAGEEDGHRHRLIELYRQRFGERVIIYCSHRTRMLIKSACLAVRNAMPHRLAVEITTPAPSVRAINLFSASFFFP